MMEPTESKIYRDGRVFVRVDIHNTASTYAWRLVVGKRASEWSQHYQGILDWCGYGLATDYWSGTLPVMIPFRISPLIAVPRELP